MPNDVASVNNNNVFLFFLVRPNRDDFISLYIYNFLLFFYVLLCSNSNHLHKTHFFVLFVPPAVIFRPWNVCQLCFINHRTGSLLRKLEQSSSCSIIFNAYWGLDESNFSTCFQHHVVILPVAFSLRLLSLVLYTCHIKEWSYRSQHRIKTQLRQKMGAQFHPQSVRTTNWGRTQPQREQWWTHTRPSARWFTAVSRCGGDHNTIWDDRRQPTCKTVAGSHLDRQPLRFWHLPSDAAA